MVTEVWPKFSQFGGSSAAAMGKSEADEAVLHQLLVAAEVAKIARKKHRHQLLEVAACERICLSCWMPCSPWIADAQFVIY